jgi:riboflavin synthase
MFTGIIEELGIVRSIRHHQAGARLVVQSLLAARTSEGGSIAVNGVCLTALQPDGETFAADLAPETLRASNLGDLVDGSTVNLELPVTPSTLLSGHIVQGHVDGTGELLSLEALGNENWWLRARIPQELDRYIVYKGSLAIDGISLTVAAIADRVASVTIIPHTFANTTLGRRKPGDRLNLECDVLAKYVEKLVSLQAATTTRYSSSEDR